MQKPAPVIFLMGPTASGKTDLAIFLQEHLPVEIISVDAAQVYRGMDIGTAKPAKKILEQYPHRIVDIREPGEPYNAADFCMDAKREIEAIQNKGKIPLLAGGTIFYFHALEFGLSGLPAADESVRQSLAVEAEKSGWPAMHARLAELDPARAAEIKPNDRQRIQRALEIISLAGRPASSLNDTDPAVAPLQKEIIRLGLIPGDRQQLYGQIEKRFRVMLQEGLVEEVRELLARQTLNDDLPAMRMVGYRQVRQYLDGELSCEEMEKKAVTATRRLAKRQLTWLRSYPKLHTFNCQDEELPEQCLQYLQTKLAQGN